jgi:hypothetical protein
MTKEYPIKTAIIREQVCEAIQRNETYGIISAACPRCNALVYFYELADESSVTGKIVRIICDDECGWKIIL